MIKENGAKVLTSLQIKTTMRGIKHVLTERWYAWEDARILAETDPSVNLYPNPGEPSYMPEQTAFEVCGAIAQSQHQNLH